MAPFMNITRVLPLLLVLVTACGGDSGIAPNPSPDSDPNEAGTVGAAGGRLTAANGKVGIVIPAGAVSSSQVITVELVTNPPSDPNLAAGSLFEFGPDGLQFAEPVTLSISFDPNSIPGHGRAAGLRIFKRVGSDWQETDGGTVDAATGTVTGEINSFSSCGILAGPCVALDLNSLVPGLNGTETWTNEHSQNCVYEQGPQGIQSRYSFHVTADQVDGNGFAYIKIDADAPDMNEQWLIYDESWNPSCAATRRGAGVRLCRLACGGV